MATLHQAKNHIFLAFNSILKFQDLQKIFAALKNIMCDFFTFQADFFRTAKVIPLGG